MTNTTGGPEDQPPSASPVPNGELPASPGGAAGPQRTPKDADDIASLWIETDIGDPLTVQQIYKIPVGKPKDYFRVHPDPAYRRKAEVYVHKIENQFEPEHFIIGPAMQGRIDEARSCILVIAVDRANQPRIWELMQPREGEKDHAAWSTARAIAREAMTHWVKMLWKSGQYVARRAEPGYAPEPDFSKLQPFDDLIRIAYGKHGIIRDEDHPIFHDLFGKAAKPSEAELDADPLR